MDSLWNAYVTWQEHTVNGLFEEINEQHVFPILLAATLTNAISNGYCIYHWPHLKKLEIFLLLSPKILLILSWKYNGYKLKKKILAILKSLPSCMCAFFTTSTNCASNRVVKLTSITMEIWKKIIKPRYVVFSIFEKYIYSAFQQGIDHFLITKLPKIITWESLPIHAFLPMQLRHWNFDWTSFTNLNSSFEREGSRTRPRPFQKEKE